jgi:mono/diheme cytochrome c family protein
VRPIVGLALAFAAAFGTRATAHDPITTRITWSKEISRIALTRCAGCHAPDGAAPMPLTTFAEARPWAKAIRDAVVTRRMPPWRAAPGVGDFQNDPSLSQFEISLIAAWAGGGTPEGNRRDLPANTPRVDLHGSTMTIRLPARRRAPAGEIEDFDIDTSSDRDRWISGWQFIPNDGAIVQAEFSHGDAAIADWAPPDGVVAFPANTGRRLPARARVHARIWYRSDRLQHDFPLTPPRRAPQLDLMIATRPPARALRDLNLGCSATAAVAVGDVVAVRPITTRAGSDIGVAIVPADGAPRPLVWVRGADPGYLPAYRLRDPVPLAPGARFDVRSSDPDCRVRVTVEEATSSVIGTVTTRPAR